MCTEPFNEVEMMYLSKLSYYDLNSEQLDSQEPLTLYKFMESNLPDLEKEFGRGSLQSFMNKIKNQNYTISSAINDRDGTGFAAIAIEGPDENTVTVATRGTEGFSMDYDSSRDVYSDAELGIVNETNQQKCAESFINDLEYKYDSLYFTGHSLGGNLAVHSAVTVSDPEKVKGVYTYNAPGQNDEYSKEHKESISMVKGKITNYQNESDAISDINDPVGKVIYVESTAKDPYENKNVFERLVSLHKLGDKLAYIGDSHLLKAMSYNDDGFVTVKKKTIIHDVFSNSVSGLVSGLTTSHAIAVLLAYCASGGKINVSEMREELAKQQYKTVSSGDSGYFYGQSIRRIFIIPEELKNRAKEMLTRKDEYEEVIKQLGNVVLSLRDTEIWHTEEAEVYEERFLEIKAIFDSFSKVMEGFSKTMENAADKLQATDDAVSSKINNISM